MAIPLEYLIFFKQIMNAKYIFVNILLVSYNFVTGWVTSLYF